MFGLENGTMLRGGNRVMQERWGYPVPGQRRRTPRFGATALTSATLTRNKGYVFHRVEGNISDLAPRLLFCLGPYSPIELSQGW